MTTDRQRLTRRTESLAAGDCVILLDSIAALAAQPMPARARRKVEAAYNAVARALFHLNDAADILGCQ